jgi:hypothetical protein
MNRGSSWSMCRFGQVACLVGWRGGGCHDQVAGAGRRPVRNRVRQACAHGQVAVGSRSRTWRVERVMRAGTVIRCRRMVGRCGLWCESCWRGFRSASDVEDGGGQGGQTTTITPASHLMINALPPESMSFGTSCEDDSESSSQAR